jgi:CSLREA domain-containing protein
MNRHDWLTRAAAIATALAATAATANTITVNSTGDAAADDGGCTLREAITAASTNLPSGATPGECAGGNLLPIVDAIEFAIPGAGVHAIQPTSVLPAIAEAVVIDGYTQPGASANTLALGDDAVLLIEIDGSLMGTGDMLRVTGSGSTIRGLVVNRVMGVNVTLGPQSPVDDNVIEGNFLNTDPSGTTQLGGQFAVVRIAGSNNVLGGTAPAARNIVAGGSGSGTHTVQVGGNGNVLQGNYIGIDATGLVALQPPTGSDGIGVGALGPATNTVIGGDVPGAGNVIHASGTALVLGPGGTGTIIQGNFIGTDATSTLPIGGSVGLSTNNAPTDIHIGGVTPLAGNVFSGLANPIILIDGPTGVVIEGNRFGTDASGTRPVPNRGSAILLHMPGVDGSIIGGTEPGAANTIAYNCGQGIQFDFGPNHWPILGNSIHSNRGLGITFMGGTPVDNDDGDGDTGSNDLQNHPVITSAVASAGSVTVSGTLNSTPSTAFRLEFFASGFCDASGHGEGQQFIGTTDVTTDASGNTAFGPLTFAAPDDAEITATATDPDGNTSEFSECAGPHDHMFADGFDVPACG